MVDVLSALKTFIKHAESDCAKITKIKFMPTTSFHLSESFFLCDFQYSADIMDITDDDILMSPSSPHNGQTKSDDLGDMTFCMSNYAKEALKMMYMMRQVCLKFLIHLIEFQ